MFLTKRSIIPALMFILAGLSLHAQDNRIYYEELKAPNKLHFSANTHIVEISGKVEMAQYSGSGVFVLKENMGSDQWGQRTYKWHFVDTTGTYLARNVDMEPIGPFRPLYFDEGVTINNNRTLCIMDKYGKVVSDLKNYAFVGNRFVDGAVLAAGERYQEGNSQYHKVNFIGRNGKVIYPNLSWKVDHWDIMSGLPEVFPISEGLRCYYDFTSKKYGYIDEAGKVVIAPKYSAAHGFSEGLAAVKMETEDGDKWGFIDKTGKVVINPKFRFEPRDFHDGWSVVTKNSGNKTLLDMEGNTVNMDCKILNDFLGGFTYLETSEQKQFIVNKELKGVEVWASRNRISLYGMDVVHPVRDYSKQILCWDPQGVYDEKYFPLVYPDYGQFSYLGDGLFWYNNQAAGGESGPFRPNGERVLVFRQSEF
ncbi:MAG: WG repeat-containing protein [Bacteroidales bacterium]|nr:WG repeat-containing protein [Bacteroidales bacterium]